jgi:hypothetical protein
LEFEIDGKTNPQISVVKVNDSEDLSKYIRHNPRRYEVCYTYFKDFEICATYNIETRRQRLILGLSESFLEENPRYENYEPLKISCIHTAVCQIPAEMLSEEMRERLDLQVQKIISKEELEELELSPKESFRAFKSWVAGIAEAGYKGLEIQSEIEAQARLVTPISSQLIKFLAKYNEEIFFEFVRRVKRQAIYEGVRAEGYILANAISLIEAFKYSDYRDDREKLEYLIEELKPKLKGLEFNYTYKTKLIGYIPNWIYKISSLKTLKIIGIKDDKESSVLDERIERLKNLRSLILEYTQINRLPNAIKKLRKLEMIRIRNYSINYSIIEIKNLDLIFEIKTLKKLHLMSTHISQEEFNKVADLKDLEEIVLVAEAFIKSIEPITKNLKKVKKLVLGWLYDIEIPKTISNLENLEHLEVIYSDIVDIPIELGNLAKLKKLIITSTTYKNFNMREIFSNLKNIEIIELQYNFITKFPMRILLKLKKLKKVYLGGNDREEILKHAEISLRKPYLSNSDRKKILSKLEFKRRSGKNIKMMNLFL